MTAPRRPAAPSHLQTPGRRLWADVLKEFDLSSGHHLAILQTAAEAADREAEAREAIARDGAFVPGRWGPRAHPALAVQNASAIRKVRALRELGLDLSDPTAPPPPTRWRP